jgi:hypothetical protein
VECPGQDVVRTGDQEAHLQGPVVALDQHQGGGRELGRAHASEQLGTGHVGQERPDECYVEVVDLQEIQPILAGLGRLDEKASRLDRHPDPPRRGEIAFSHEHAHAGLSERKSDASQP